MENYFNFLPVDIILIISTYLDREDFSNWTLSFNDYISRSILELYYNDFYNKYKRIRRDISMRLNKLLSMISYYISILFYYKKILKDFIDNFHHNYYHMDQHEFNRLHALSEQSLEKEALYQTNKFFPVWIETFSSILLLMEFPKMYNKIDDDVQKILYKPYCNILSGCFIINSVYNQYGENNGYYTSLYIKYINKGIIPNIEDISDLTYILNNYPELADIMFLIILDIKKMNIDINIDITKKNIFFSLLNVTPYYNKNFHLIIDFILNK